jgi:hypothetical protein
VVIARDGLGVVGDSVLERLSHCPDSGEWSAKVMRDPRDQLAPRCIQCRFAGTCLLELGGGLLQALCESRQLARGRSTDVGYLLSRSDARCGAFERAACLCYPRAEREGKSDADGAGHNEDHDECAEVVGGKEHLLRSDRSTRAYRADTRQRDHGDLSAQPAASK